MYSLCFFYCLKLKTADERRISDWSADVCSPDLGWGGVSLDSARTVSTPSQPPPAFAGGGAKVKGSRLPPLLQGSREATGRPAATMGHDPNPTPDLAAGRPKARRRARAGGRPQPRRRARRSEEHTSEPQSLLRNSNAVSRLKQKNKT